MKIVASTTKSRRKKQATFSVVTVVLNNRAGLKATSDSLLSQEYSIWEWIVVDGGSQDGTVELIESLADHIAFWSSKPDKGLYDAMNKGLDHCRNDYVVFLNSGDTFYDNGTLGFVAKAVDVCAEPPGLIFGDAMLCFSTNRIVRRQARRIENYLWHGLPALHQATYFRRDLHQETPYDLSYSVSADYAAVATISQKTSAIYLSRPLSVNMSGGNSFSFKNWRRLLLDCIRIQRVVLSMGWPRISYSLARRLLNTFGFMLFSKGGSFFVEGKKIISPARRIPPT